MTIQSSCFWSLLSLDKLEFKYVPLSVGNIKISAENNQITIQDVLLHRSVFEFMHPSEIKMAKQDLSSFLKLKTLAGSVTRCRLLSFKSIAHHALSKDPSLSSSYQDWNIIDLVIYTATDDTVLAFFHNTDFASCRLENGPLVSNPSCAVRSEKPCFDYEDALHLLQVLHLMQTTPTVPITEDHHLISPIRIFQIVDSISLKPLFSWPQFYTFVDMIQSLAKEITLKEFKNPNFGSSPTTNAAEVSCTRYFYANSKIELFLTRKACNFQRILIPYGNILFEAIQVSPILINTTITSSILGNQPAGMYMNNFAFFFNVKKVLKSDNEKEEADRELALTFQHEYAVNTLDLQAGRETLGLETRQNQIYQAHQPCTSNSTVYPSSSKLQKFRVQQQVQQELTIKQQSFVSIEKKRRNEIFGANATISTWQEHRKACTRCHTINSPEWRRGPDGHKTLCNACGLRYSRLRSKQWRSTATNPSSSSSLTNSSFSTPK
ncbi:hypothetical protein BD408DRAFT_439446 [Parasitella parasitica]|nr:hypothetical protein BD408DRAFT_439446 [Parasitella parasitica]